VDGNLLQTLIGGGYAKAAAHIGTLHAWYRAANPLFNPTQPQNQLGTLAATFALDPQFQSVPNYGSILWRAFVDVTQAQPGDVLVGENTWVLVSAGPIFPPQAVLATDVISIARPKTEAQLGVQDYGGGFPQAEGFTLIGQGIPANTNTKKEVGVVPAKLPGDAGRVIYWSVSFWAPSGSVQERDIITDQNGNRYQVTAANWQPIGYQCLCERLEA